jgi:hypothetical protein
LDPLGLDIGDLPPPPPNYDPSTWRQGKYDNGKYYLTDPDNNKWVSHEEDKTHWRHWDKFEKDDNGNTKNKGRWPQNSKKPWDNQKKKLNIDQSSADPSGDTPSWDPMSDLHYIKHKTMIYPTIIINPKMPILNPSDILIDIPIPFFRIPIFVN